MAFQPNAWNIESMSGPLSHHLGRFGVAALMLLAGLAALWPAVDPRLPVTATAAIFVASYGALALGRIPGLAVDRAGIALVGACLMVAAGALTLEQAHAAIHLDTITLLLGMMIIVATLRLSGFFALANGWITRRVHHPLVLLAAITLVSGVSSAFLVNDAICLVLTPLVVELVVGLRRNPVPYLLAVAMASNVGSTATITGNPQNIMIGGLSGIPYARFAAALSPVAAFGLVAIVVLLAVAFRREFLTRDRLAIAPVRIRVNRALVWRSLAATGVLIALFFAGQSPAKVAIILGGLLLLTRRMRSARVYAEIDWSLLLMFAGLFIIVAGAERVLLTPEMVAGVAGWHLDRVPVLAGITAVLSNIVSNVPAVLMLKPFIEVLPDQAHAWLVVAMASTLAGNFTVLGSIANLIVVEKAARRGIVIGFWDYARIGMPLTLVTLAFGTWWMGR